MRGFSEAASFSSRTIHSDQSILHSLNLIKVKNHLVQIVYRVLIWNMFFFFIKISVNLQNLCCLKLTPTNMLKGSFIACSKTGLSTGINRDDVFPRNNFLSHIIWMLLGIGIGRDTKVPAVFVRYLALHIFRSVTVCGFIRRLPLGKSACGFCYLQFLKAGNGNACRRPQCHSFARLRLLRQPWVNQSESRKPKWEPSYLTRITFHSQSFNEKERLFCTAVVVLKNVIICQL